MIRQIKELPRLPQVSIEIIRQAFRDEPDIQKIASIIERVPTLTAKLFKTVNCASFGLKMEVSSIQQAVSIIGLDALRSTIVSLALGDYYNSSCLGNALDAKTFCVHSLATAVIMQEAARELGIKEDKELYLLGLLHDLGRLALDSIPDSDYREVLNRVEQGMTFEDAEREVFYLDNRQVWQFLARTWEFPPKIVKLNRSFVEGKFAVKTRKLIDDASDLADRLGYGISPAAPVKEPQEANIFCRIDKTTMHRINKEVEKQVAVMGQVLDLPVPDNTEIKNLLMTTSHQLSIITTKYIRSRNELKLRVDILEELTRVFTGIIKTLDTDSFSFSVLESVMEGFGVDGAFLLVASGKDSLAGYTARNDEAGESDVDHVQLDAEQISGSIKKAMLSRGPIQVKYPAQEKELARCLGPVNLAWLVPITVRSSFSALLGIGVKDKNNAKLTNKEFGMIFNIIAGEVALSLENSRLFSRMQKEARFDALTGTFNRRTIMKILDAEFARYKRKKDPFSVGIFDMDNFKAINDTRGHIVGDEFLIKVAKTIKAELRESDFVGRYGGDEFLAIFPYTTPEEAERGAERVRAKLEEYCSEFQGPDIKKKLSVSIGIAGAEEYMSESKAMLTAADNAMYRAKEKGGNRCETLMPSPTA
jgi:diguanylate cyclase (GGDEF)-like protein